MTLACSFALGVTCAAAQDYPNRPIRIIVGFAPGGGVDTVARLVGQEMSKSLGQSIVIENRPGAAGTIGAGAAARSEADGYTLVMLPGGHALYGATHKSLPFDTVNGFEWISTIVTLQFLALVRAEFEIPVDARADRRRQGGAGDHHLCQRRRRLDAPPHRRDDRPSRRRQAAARPLSG